METYRNVVCVFCGCLCDDLEVTVEDGEIKEVKAACSLGGSKFLTRTENRLLEPYIRENREKRRVSLEEAVKRTAEILVNSNCPVLYGWSNTSNETIRKGVELTELVNGVMDNTASVCHGPSILGEQDIGLSGATLGEIKNRADLIIFWGCNPLHAHPRHMRRYSGMAKGMFTGKGRKDRKIVVIDVRRTFTARTADKFIQIEPNKDFELLSALRMAVMDKELEIDEVAGISVSEIEELAELMINARFGALFFGLGLTMSKGKHRNIDAAVSLVQTLNQRTKFVIMPMRGHYNVTGANKVTTWLTGYPFAVSFLKGYPRYNPGETTVIDIFSRGECDCALIVASDPIANFPKEALKHLRKTKLITIDPKVTLTTEMSDIVIPSAIAGVEAEGTAYRMDGVPLPLKKVVDPPPNVYPDEKILEMIIEEVKKLQ